MIWISNMKFTFCNRVTIFGSMSVRLLSSEKTVLGDLMNTLVTPYCTSFWKLHSFKITCELSRALSDLGGFGHVFFDKHL